MVVHRPGVEPEEGVADPTRLVCNLLGTELPLTVLATDGWQARMLLADRYCSPRMFVAGDSAHLNPPWGGHGFNTGIGDAVNIGWKLAGVIKDWAPTSLLTSYEPERRPVAAGTIDEAARNMATLSIDLADARLLGSDADFAACRPSIAAAIHASKDSEFHSFALTLGYHYENSPVVFAEKGLGRGRDTRGYQPSAAPGHRLPHRWLAPGVSLYDQLGKCFSLIGDLRLPAARELAAAARSQGVPFTLVDLTEDCWREFLGAGLVLVRPDQHVAWRGDRTDDPLGVIRRTIGCPSP